MRRCDEVPDDLYDNLITPEDIPMMPRWWESKLIDGSKIVANTIDATMFHSVVTTQLTKGLKIPVSQDMLDDMVFTL
jgi:hypothetical protein